MRLTLESEDVESIALKVVELLKPLISNHNKHDEDVIFDVPALCNYLSVSDKWVYERTHLKEIPYLKINGLLRFRKSEIDKWIRSFSVPATNRPVKGLRIVK